jgi:A/G-specific adenine glycosylase
MNKLTAPILVEKKVPALAIAIFHWYKQHKRNLPWRKNNDPYRIWISEIMLQQTTVQAVIPYYNRFLTAFPDVHSLANVPVEQILPLWAGLGYYSRARNLHKAAQVLSKKGFANNYNSLQELPGIGPYTARAISSIAFNEPVGVLDGNVIRILCRVFGLMLEWWKPKERTDLQTIADLLAQQHDSATINQAMMELGATICTPKNPACNICPWQTRCLAFKNNQVLQLPLKKERKSFEIWYWTPQIIINKKTIALIENETLPFLKKSLIPPGSAKKLKQKPKQFDFSHTITHHKIYVKADLKKGSASKLYRWVNLNQLAETNPSSLLQKTLNVFGV